MPAEACEICASAWRFEALGVPFGSASRAAFAAFHAATAWLTDPFAALRLPCAWLTPAWAWSTPALAWSTPASGLVDPGLRTRDARHGGQQRLLRRLDLEVGRRVVELEHDVARRHRVARLDVHHSHLAARRRRDLGGHGRDHPALGDHVRVGRDHARHRRRWIGCDRRCTAAWQHAHDGQERRHDGEDDHDPHDDRQLRATAGSGCDGSSGHARSLMGVTEA